MAIDTNQQNEERGASDAVTIELATTAMGLPLPPLAPPLTPAPTGNAVLGLLRTHSLTSSLSNVTSHGLVVQHSCHRLDELGRDRDLNDLLVRGMGHNQGKRLLLFNPRGRIRLYWDIFVLLLLGYDALVIPYRIGFQVEPSAWWYWFERTVDISFILDVFINFNTAVEKHAELIVCRKEIAKKYLRGWFWIDFPSAIPFDLFFIGLSGSKNDLPRILRLLKLTRLIKLMRLLRLPRILGRLEKSMNFRSSLMVVSSYIIFFVLVSHWAACTFHWITHSVSEATWIEKAGLSDAVSLDRFVASLYWSLMTVTTTGFGDIAATSWQTRLFSIFLMSAGATIFAFGITQVATLVQALDVEKEGFRKKMLRVEAYMKKRNLPKSLRLSIREYLEFSRRISAAKVLREQTLLNDVSRGLRSQIVQEVNESLMATMPMIVSPCTPFKVDLLMSMHPRCFPPGEIIVHRGDEDSKLFILRSGLVARTDADENEVQLAVGATFGGFNLLSMGVQSQYSYRASSWCECRVLTRAALLATLRRYPEILDTVMRNARERFCSVIRGDASSRINGLRMRARRVLCQDDAMPTMSPTDQEQDDHFYRFDRDFAPCEDGVSDFAAILSMIEHLSIEQAKALLLVTDSLLTKFMMQQSILHAAELVVGGNPDHSSANPSIKLDDSRANSQTSRLR